jgi:hypothetical protein
MYRGSGTSTLKVSYFYTFSARRKAVDGGAQREQRADILSPPNPGLQLPVRSPSLARLAT